MEFELSENSLFRIRFISHELRTQEEHPQKLLLGRGARPSSFQQDVMIYKAQSISVVGFNFQLPVQ